MALGKAVLTNFLLRLSSKSLFVHRQTLRLLTEGGQKIPAQFMIDTLQRLGEIAGVEEDLEGQKVMEGVWSWNVVRQALMILLPLIDSG